MGNWAIRTEGLGKQYTLGARESYLSLRDSFSGLFSGLWRATGGATGRNPGESGPSTQRNGHPPTIWALKEVSFEIEAGEAVGIIGRNGAGKSTLLKILSRIVEPTEGRARVRGHVGSLLEVGTGFHPELTGRENIYLNGAILGMKRGEIQRKLDEIVAFAEVEKFIDTPVKRYSSGMYVRLAFAVAAHLEPEILLVDEVLAVGDAAFQKKCLGKMGTIGKEGRTVFFVSHNMAAINQLCRSVIWLDSGQVRQFSRDKSAISQYLLAGTESSGRASWADDKNPPGDERARLLSVSLLDADGQCTGTVDRMRGFRVEIEYQVSRPMQNLRAGFQILTPEGMIVLSSPDSEAWERGGSQKRAGRYQSMCEVPGEFLNSGSYVLRVGMDIQGGEPICLLDSVLQFEVVDTTGISGTFQSHAGVVYRRLPWEIVQVGELAALG